MSDVLAVEPSSDHDPTDSESFFALNQPWRKDAECHGMSRLFFLERDDGWCGPDRHHPAIKVCKGCRVREECLEYALEHNERVGVWGGTTPQMRRKIRRRRRLGL